MSTFSIMNMLSSVSNLFLTVIGIVLYLAYLLKKRYSYWAERGFPYLKPVPFFGNTKDHFFRRVSYALDLQRIYNELDGHKFGGFFDLMRPTLLLREPETIRLFLIKKFSHFHDRYSHLNEKVDPLSAHTANLRGQRWTNVRRKLVFIFNSGKLRPIYDLVSECVNEFDEYLVKVTSKNGSGSDQNVTYLTWKLMTDVIGSCAFGVRNNSFRDEDSEMQRLQWSLQKSASRLHLRNVFQRVNLNVLTRVFKIKAFDSEVVEFVFSILRDAARNRETKSSKRNDFLQLLINIQAEEREQYQAHGHSYQHEGLTSGTREENYTNEFLFTDNIVASNTFIFLQAGVDTSSTTLTYILYESALNPEFFEKLRAEVESVKRKHNGTLNYDALKELSYMDMVVSECLRKYPVTPLLIRQCTETFKIPETSVVIEKGLTVIVPVHALHHDPKYFPEPDEFIPERFSAENKDSIVPGSYLPFGDGPRMCIAMRFSMLQIKETLARIVSKYTVHPCDKTQIPMKFNRKNPHLLLPEEGVWIQLRRRQTT